MTRSRLVGAALVVMIVAPAVVLAVLGYRSFDSELRAERAEVRSRVSRAFGRVWDSVDRTLANIENDEAARDFWVYRSLFVDIDAVTGETVRRLSSLGGAEQPAHFRGYWQFDLTHEEIALPGFDAPIGDRVPPWFRAGFEEEVAAHLRRFPPTPGFTGVRAEVRRYDRRLVEGNLTPLNDAQQVEISARPGLTEVRYGAFDYVADPPGEAVYARRTVTWPEGNRTIVQGFVMDVEVFLRETIPALADRAGERDVTFRVVPTPPRSYAYPPNRPLGAMLPGLSLLAEEADGGAAARSVSASRERFVLLVGALFAVIAAGLVLLQRTVRAEVALARRRSDFVSAVSHELRTPLTGIRMYADMLRDGWVDDPEKIREYHESMARESERLSRLVQNVLDFSALEKGRKDYRLERGGLAEPVREALDLLAPYLAEKGFEATLDVPEKLPDVARDADAVQQCVVNLVDNAVKYAKGHEPRRIEVALSAAGGFVELSVRDHGPGMPPEERERAFTPFYRGRSPDAREVGGAGLGLSLVRQFAKAHGGTAIAEPAHPAGLRIRLTFPIGAGRN